MVDSFLLFNKNKDQTRLMAKFGLEQLWTPTLVKKQCRSLEGTNAENSAAGALRGWRRCMNSQCEVHTYHYGYCTLDAELSGVVTCLGDYWYEIVVEEVVLSHAVRLKCGS